MIGFDMAASSPRETRATELVSSTGAGLAIERLEELPPSQRYNARTAEAYCAWARRFYSVWLRRPVDDGADVVRFFLSELAVRKHVSASTENQARSALVFLFRWVIRSPLPS